MLLVLTILVYEFCCPHRQCCLQSILEGNGATICFYIWWWHCLLETTGKSLKTDKNVGASFSLSCCSDALHLGLLLTFESMQTLLVYMSLIYGVSMKECIILWFLLLFFFAAFLHTYGLPGNPGQWDCQWINQSELLSCDLIISDVVIWSLFRVAHLMLFYCLWTIIA